MQHLLQTVLSMLSDTNKGGSMYKTALSVGLVLVFSVSIAVGADITGKWDVKVISISDGEVHGVAGFVQHGDTVKGWLGPGENDPIPITLALKGNKLTIWTHPQHGRNVVFARCDLTIDGDKMNGTIDTDKGTIEFVRISHAPPPFHNPK